MDIQNPKSEIRNPQDSDPFDRLYHRMAEQAMRQRLDPPSRQRWNLIVLRLILSEDPDRVRRYRYVEGRGPESLGADAYALWRKTPEYTPNLSVPVKGFEAYEQEQQGSMRRLMEAQGLLDRYNAIIKAQEQRQLTDEEKARARRGQQQVIMMGCIGIAAMVFMVLAVLLIIIIQLVN